MSDDPRSEFRFIDWLRRQTSATPGVELGPGDDAALARLTPGRSMVVTTDMLMQGSCFLIDEAGPERVGRKAINVNLSDIAAMAALPRYALVAVGLPRGRSRELAEGLYRGMRQAADRFGVAIIGGDTSAWDGELVVSVTLIGEEGERPSIRRSGAKAGDVICVTGRLGGSILGKHLDFTPRVAEAITLANYGITAMIDLSDGLSADLAHICRESGVGAELAADRIPIDEAAVRLAETSGRTALDHALGDGEDFELLFTLPEGEAVRLLGDQPFEGVPVMRIGRVTEELGMRLRRDGRVEELRVTGYGHEIG